MLPKPVNSTNTTVTVLDSHLQDALKDLYERFDSWSLSLAAYNMGEEGLAAEILEQGVTDYYRLYLLRNAFGRNTDPSCGYYLGYEH